MFQRRVLILPDLDRMFLLNFEQKVRPLPLAGRFRFQISNLQMLSLTGITRIFDWLFWLRYLLTVVSAVSTTTRTLGAKGKPDSFAFNFRGYIYMHCKQMIKCNSGLHSLFLNVYISPNY